MAYKPSESRYAGGGQVKYLVYESPQPLRSGRLQQRTHVQRLYFPADAKDITVEPNVKAAIQERERVVITKVRIVEKSNNSGRIEIDYYSSDDLDRIYTAIAGDTTT